MSEELRHRIFQAEPPAFEELALEAFHFQAQRNPVYREFLQALQRDPREIKSLGQVPFLPVEQFKTQRVICEGCEPQVVFSSSGTTGHTTSQHFVADVALYEESFRRAFRFFYNDPQGYCILALLPSYLERSGSSLVHMADRLIRESQHPESGFYLHDYAELAQKLRRLNDTGQPTLLLGVTYALLDLAEQFPQALPHTIIMETGGMKGKRKEIVREELHAVLKNAFAVPHIHSEYGMTELLSQAYSKGEGKFFCPPWMRVRVRDVNDPFSCLPEGRTGGLNIIDLANLYSCSFIAVSDLGRSSGDGSFEVLGRFDNSDIRGCNLLVE